MRSGKLATLILLLFAACSFPAGNTLSPTRNAAGGTLGTGGKPSGATGGTPGNMGGAAGSKPGGTTGGAPGNMGGIGDTGGSTNAGGSWHDAGNADAGLAPGPMMDGAARDAGGTVDVVAEPSVPLSSKLSFTDWYIEGLKGSADGAFSFASRTGLSGVEVFVEFNGNTPRMLESDALRKQYVDAQQKYGKKISSFQTGGFWMDKLVTDPFAVEKLKNLVQLCVRMDVHRVLVPAFVNYDSASVTDMVVERLKQVGPVAEAAGVVLGIENYLSAERNAAIMKRVASPGVKIYYDIGNSSQRKFDIYSEIRMLGDSISQFHVKDTARLGKGIIDLVKFKQALIDINYKGWLILELSEGEAAYKADADYLKTLFTP